MAYGSLFYDGNNYKHLAWPYCISFNLLNKKFTFYLPRIFLIYSIAANVQKLQKCLEYEIHNKLQPRILKKGEVKPPDYDEFIQCYECGNVFPIHETHFESKIKDSLETTDNPFENESILLSTDNRATQRCKG